MNAIEVSTDAKSRIAALESAKLRVILVEIQTRLEQLASKPSSEDVSARIIRRHAVRDSRAIVRNAFAAHGVKVWGCDVCEDRRWLVLTGNDDDSPNGLERVGAACFVCNKDGLIADTVQ